MNRATGHNVGAYFPDMVHTAIEEARKAYAKPRSFLRSV